MPFLVVDDLAYIYGLVALVGFFNGGLNTLAFALVGTSVPADKQGVAYGISQSATALGWGAGPLAGGALAAMFGLRQVFLMNAIALFVSALFVARLLSRDDTQTNTKAADSESETADHSQSGTND